MKKKIGLVSGVLIFLLFLKIVLSLNIDFTINLAKKSFFPNETIPIDMFIVNREVQFATRNLSLNIIIGQKTYSFELGDLAASQSITKSITLPEQVPGAYIIHGILKYIGYFGEITTLDAYNSFEVKFPEITRFPRNIYIKSFDVPENITAGKTYEISINVINNGTVDGDLIIKVESLGINVSERIHLKPNETESVKLNVTFYNPGISLVEAKVYAIVDGIKYLLNHVSKNVYVIEEQIAKLEFDRIELVDEPDNKVNQVDEVILNYSIFPDIGW